MNAAGCQDTSGPPLQRHETLVGIDSDGCVFDSLPVKLHNHVVPLVIRWWGLEPVAALVHRQADRINRFSAAAAQLFFYAFAAVMGLSIAWIFKAFTDVSIAQTFLVTSIAFAGLSLYGYVTKRDLSGMGTFLMMGLIGLLVAMVVNIFLASSALAFAISVIGVLIFAGLTAYDTQNIKNTYIQHAAAMDQEWLGKSAIMGALNLYLDFINLFMFLLQFMGNNRE